MPLLRRPHDHCRGLCARRRTARPTVRPRRDQDRDAMTPVAVSSQHTAAPKPRSRLPAPLPRRLRRPRHITDQSSITPSTATRPQNPTAIIGPPPIATAKPSPAKAAAQPNPHRRPTAHRSRGFLLRRLSDAGRRTHTGRSLTTGRHPKPLTIPAVRATTPKVVSHHITIQMAEVALPR